MIAHKVKIFFQFFDVSERIVSIFRELIARLVKPLELYLKAWPQIMGCIGSVGS